jgi:hypothetical protein
MFLYVMFLGSFTVSQSSGNCWCLKIHSKYIMQNIIVPLLNCHRMEKAIFSVFNIIDLYTKVNNNAGCCTSGKYHQRCACIRSLSDCKKLCTRDTNCKGYVQTTRNENCNIATTSNCPRGCPEHDTGTVGDLELEIPGTCIVTNPVTYHGCFIKSIVIKNMVFRILIHWPHYVLYYIDFLIDFVTFAIIRM